jgi:hypothetical protein
MVTVWSSSGTAVFRSPVLSACHTMMRPDAPLVLLPHMHETDVMTSFPPIASKPWMPTHSIPGVALLKIVGGTMSCRYTRGPERSSNTLASTCCV